ncbi:hypothetical protein [Ruminococcus sp.]|uniref:hypothetical protein n=1 Tax=Ruminococcus sp. TaxID=41978 RepID=UPI003967475E
MVNSAPLYYPPVQSKIRKERSDFAAAGTCPNEPVLGVCCKFRIVGDDALGVPLGGILLYFLYL